MNSYRLSTWLVSDLSPDEAVRLLTSAGFGATELSADFCPMVQAWEAEPVANADAWRAARVSPDSAHTPEAGRFIDVLDGATRAASIAEDMAYLDKMAASGVSELIVHPTSSSKLAEGDTWEAVKERSRDSIAQLADRAAKLGLRLAVENLGKPPRVCARIEEILGIIDGIGDHVGVCHDVGHTVQGGLDPVAEVGVALASGRLFSLHLHDVDPDLRDHYLPGEGTVDLTGIISALDGAGFTGARTLEIAPGRGPVDERVRLAARIADDWGRAAGI